MKNFTNNANKMINNHIQTNTESISQLNGSLKQLRQGIETNRINLDKNTKNDEMSDANLGPRLQKVEANNINISPY